MYLQSGLQGVYVGSYNGRMGFLCGQGEDIWC